MMISAIFDLMSACGHFMWNVLCALIDFGFKLVSAVGTVLSWPVRAAASLLRGTLSWTPFFLFVCLVLGVLLVVFMAAALIGRSHNHFK